MAAWREKREREKESVHVWKVTVNMAEERERGRGRDTERLYPQQKRIKWVSVREGWREGDKDLGIGVTVSAEMKMQNNVELLLQKVTKY